MAEGASGGSTAEGAGGGSTAEGAIGAWRAQAAAQGGPVGGVLDAKDRDETRESWAHGIDRVITLPRDNCYEPFPS